MKLPSAAVCPSRCPSLQAIVATLLWTLSGPEPALRCPRQLAMALHQLRFVLSHPEAEPLLQDVAAAIVANLEDALTASIGMSAVDAGRSSTLLSIRH